MRLPPSQISAIRADLGREPTPIEERIIRSIVQLQCIIDKDQSLYDKQQPVIITTGYRGQTKVASNPLADRISKNLERLARMLNYLNRNENMNENNQELDVPEIVKLSKNLL